MAKYTAERFRKEKQELINQILNSDLHGKKIYLLGSAEFGPTNEPILIKSTIGLYNKFGRQGTLVDAFHAVKYVNKNSQVYLVKTTGEHANAYLNVNIYNGEIIKDGLIVTSSESNEAFNEVEIIIDIDRLTFVFPDDMRINSKVYKFEDYPTIERLTNAINRDTKIKKNKLFAYYTVDPSTPTKNAFYVCNPTIVYMYGGQCGLNYTKNMLYNCLARTYNMLESEDIDIIIPVDAFLDDVFPSQEKDERYGMKYYQSSKDYLTEDVAGNVLTYMNQLINFCIKQLRFGVVTTGVIGFNSIYKTSSDYLSEADELISMYKACFEFNLKHCTNSTYSFMVSCVAGDIKYNHGTIIDNGYLAYASFCSKTVITSGTTNMPVSNTIALYQEFSEEILNDLAETGIVAFRHSPLYNTPVVYSGITASNNKNMKIYANVRMIQICMSYVNKLFQFYIGYSIKEIVNDGIMTNDVDTILSALSTKGVITDYDFKIIPNYKTGKVILYLTLKTCYMIDAITLRGALKADSEEV